jgi:hypothetical protein
VNTYLKRCRWGQFLLVRGDLISEYVNLYGEWCEGEVELFRALLPEDGVAVEVGSNIGMHAVPISRFCARGALFCYEPQRVVNMLCLPRGRTPPLPLVPVTAWAELEAGGLPLY